ncbi:hypothetical protein [Cellulomonas hominis]|uniref:hypothetical protein n=1 Tax=Cellulomonas hominis TaxID=156981 RepID=UPI001BCE2CA9|nr:hypothetical protein [Cellulomonas hominis]
MSNPYAPPATDRSAGPGVDAPGTAPGSDVPGTAREPGTPAPPPDPETLARVGRLVRHFGVWLVAGVAASLLPLPWQAATVLFLVGAVLAGARALRTVAVARLRGGLLPMLVGGLLLTGLLLAGMLSSLVAWGPVTDRQRCLEGALTESARATCERDYRQAVEQMTGLATAP